jgi:hypothetical protein
MMPAFALAPLVAAPTALTSDRHQKSTNAPA